jgi:hypothetical protein
MMGRFLPLLLLFAFLSGCDRLRSGYEIFISHNNLSNSYVNSYRILINGKAGFPAGEVGCSGGFGTSSISMLSMEAPPEFVLVEWLHILDNQYYRARVPLDERTTRWLRDPPLEQTREAGPALIAQWRGERRVAVMLVADPLDFSKGSLDLGEATGEAMAPPEPSPNYDVSYETLAPEPGDQYLPGAVRDYDRTLDQNLTWEQRFGCPRNADGSVDESRLPPAKLPFYYGPDGEHVPCERYFCKDTWRVHQPLRKLGWRTYPPDSTPPPITFRDAPDPKPAW